MSHRNTKMLFTRRIGDLPRILLPYLFKCHISTRYYSEQLSSRNKELLKEDINHYLENHYYHLVATKAFGNTVTSSGKTINEIDDGEQIIPPLSETFTSSRSNWKFVLSRENSKPEYIRIKSKTIFNKGYKALGSYIKDEVPAALAPAFRALERFYGNKEKHENSLKQLTSGKMSETKIASLLAQHLLTQLLPHPTNFFLDRDSMYKQDGCPCGCGQPIHFGLTQLGSAELFHGQADMILFPSDMNLFMGVEDSVSALFTLKKRGDESLNDLLTNGECEDDNTTAECERKEFDTYQACKQAISASLCKQNGKLKNNNNSGVAIVPVCAVSEDSYYVVMYDAENDYLVKMYDNGLKLFHGHSVRFPAVLDIWLLINHDLFCTKPNAKILNGIRGTCNLIPQLGKERYESIVRNSKWLYQPERYPRVEIYPDDFEFKDLDRDDEPV